MRRFISCFLILVALSAAVFAEDPIGIRKTPLANEPEPPRMANVENKDLRRERAYPMQPPTIPHKIDNYQVDLNSNKCMSCHSRDRVQDSQAPMISVTHFMDREGNFLAELSPRRYFCEQCHVVQTDAKPLVDNDFRDMNELIDRKREGRP